MLPQPRSVNAGTDSTPTPTTNLESVQRGREVGVARFLCHCTSYPIAWQYCISRVTAEASRKFWPNLPLAFAERGCSTPVGNQITCGAALAYQYINAGPFQSSSSSYKGSNGTSEDSLSCSSPKPVKGRHKFPDAVFPA